MRNRIGSLAATTWLAALVAAFVLAAPGVAASKPKPKRATELTLSYNMAGQNFRGRVKSANVCEASRKVILFQDPDDGDPVRVETTSTTNAGGRYAFGTTWPELDSSYFTKAPRKQVGGVICKAGESNRVVFAG